MNLKLSHVSKSFAVEISFSSSKENRYVGLSGNTFTVSGTGMIFVIVSKINRIIPRVPLSNRKGRLESEKVCLKQEENYEL